MHISRLVETDFGERVARRVGAEVVLRPGLNEGIDADFWSAWCQQHHGEPLAEHFAVVAEEETAADPLPRELLLRSGGLTAWRHTWRGTAR